MLPILLILAQATTQLPDTAAYATPALRALIGRAATVNASPPADFRAYTSRYESEVALVKLLPGRIQGASTIEQTAGVFTWVADSGFGQHQQGYRVITTGVPLPGAAALSNGWIIPTLTGRQWNLFGSASGAKTTVGADSGGDYSAWSPLGPNRDQFYRFEGGDTVTMAFPTGPEARLVRIAVWPREAGASREKVFRGDIYLDPETGVLRRVRGQFLTIGGPPPSGRSKFLNKLALNGAIADIVTTEVPGAGWLPTYQRIDLEVLIPLTTESWSILRVMTRLGDIEAVVDAPGATPAPLPPLEPGRSVTTKDSLHDFRGWK
ncbi:MAG TPA: hypothetical protein PKA66_00485, partial [Gemmatimonadales bacterium]|nr:hypothetical protein [Gemmatimonadales bacterium]